VRSGHRSPAKGPPQKSRTAQAPNRPSNRGNSNRTPISSVTTAQFAANGRGNVSLKQLIRHLTCPAFVLPQVLVSITFRSKAAGISGPELSEGVADCASGWCFRRLLSQPAAVFCGLALVGCRTSVICPPSRNLSPLRATCRDKAAEGLARGGLVFLFVPEADENAGFGSDTLIGQHLRRGRDPAVMAQRPCE